MNTPPDLLGSRKFKALLLAVILLGIPVVCMGVALAMGKATFDQFTELTKFAFASLAAVVSVFMGAVAHEDAAQKSNGPVNAGGDVTINNPPASGAPPAGGTTVVEVPRAPGVPGGFGSLAPTARKAGVRLDPSGDLSGPSTPPTVAKVIARIGFTLMALALLAGCTGIFKQDAKTALDVEQAACVLANIALDVPAIHTICRISDALDPELEKLLAAGRKVAASKGAPVCRDAGVP